MQVKLHSYLITEILKSNRADLHRAYAMWAYLRMLGFRFDFSDLLIEFEEKTGKNERTIRRWLNAGEGIFWNTNKNGVWLIGKDRVGNHFGLPVLGRVLLADEKDLFGGLQHLRATLSTGWFNGKEKVFASRATIKNIIGKSHQTQLNYEEHTKQKKIFIKSNEFKSEYGDNWRQFPNIYYAVNYAKHYKKSNEQRWDFYPVEDQKGLIAGNKFLYYSIDKATHALQSNRVDSAIAINEYYEDTAYVSSLSNV